MEFGYSAQDIEDFILNGLRFGVQARDNAVTLLGLKGFLVYSPGAGTLNRNEPDLYNDTFLAVWHENLTTKHDDFRCTLEPGRYYTEHPLNPGGAARLPECRLLQFKWGTHHNKPALVPADLDVVVRDANGNYRIDPHERVHIGNFQVRIHSGGDNLNSIGEWSAGCPAVYREKWERLLKICERHPFERFNIILGRGYDFYHWLLLKEAGRLDEFRATVHVGSRDGLEKGNVWKLQMLLNKDYSAGLNPDGDFGLKTLRAFMAAQESLNVFPVRAVCSRPMWERLREMAGPYEDEIGGYNGFWQ